jgi:hypothetical protein
VSEDEEFHVSPKLRGEPFVVFAMHCIRAPLVRFS